MEKIAEKIKFHGVVREEVDTAVRNFIKHTGRATVDITLFLLRCKPSGVRRSDGLCCKRKGERLGYPSHFGSIAEYILQLSRKS